MSYKQKENKNVNFILGNKIPPHSLNAEISVLGSMLLNKDAIGKALYIIQDSNIFYSEIHKIIFEAISNMYYLNIPVDILTLSENLNKKGKLKFIGGDIYLAELCIKTPSAGNVESHAFIVLEKYIRRETINTSGELLNDAFNSENDILDYIDKAEEKIFKLGEKRFSNNYKLPIEVAKLVIDDLEKKLSGKQEYLNFFLPKLNKLTGGAQGGDLIVIAGATSMGKTQFTHDLIRDFTFIKNKPVGLLSLEMSESQNFFRQLQMNTGISPEKLRTGKSLTDEELNLIKEFAKTYSKSKLFIGTKPAMTTRECISTARRMKKEHKIKALFIDHIGLMQYSGEAQNREQEIAKISACLKALALELDIPVFYLCQFNRKVIETRDKRPALANLRDSGAIEQDADIVLLLYRPFYYKITSYKFSGRQIDAENITEVICAKNRGGSAIGTIVTKSNQFTRSLTELTFENSQSNSTKYYEQFNRDERELKSF